MLLLGGGGSLEETEASLLGMGIVRGLLSRLDDRERKDATGTIRAELERRHEADVGVRMACGVWLVTAQPST